MEMNVVLIPDADAGAADVERLGRQLRNELRSVDVDDVVAVHSDVPPARSKGPVAEVLTEWLVTLSASGGVFPTLIATVKDWLGRRARGQMHKVVISIDGDSLELSSATTAEQTELVKSFVQRHATR